MSRQILAAACVCIFSINGLSAHDLYILPDGFIVAPKSKLSVALHNGDAFPESEGPPAMARVRNAQLRSFSGAFPIQDLHVTGKRAVGTVQVPPAAGISILSVETVPNFISLAPDKFLEYIKEEGLRHVIEWRVQHRETDKPSRERYSKFAKSILLSGTPNDFYKQPVGFPIEIIPDANPYTLGAGENLPVRVVVRGKPAPDLQLEAAWAAGGTSKTVVIGRTDTNGRINVPITAAGKWRLHSLTMERCADPAAADWESLWASLTFEVR